MNAADYLEFDATGLAALVAAGEVSAAELLDCALRQSERVNPRTNAVCRPMVEQARAALQDTTVRPDAPFRGVPFLIKDGGQAHAGVPTSFGSRGMLRITPSVHSHVVRRFLQSGLVVFGKTNVPEFLLKSATDSALFGVASNPWDLTRTPGGSSGGAAAAVASGVVPMAGANDGGGSIRIPASYCGLFGLRPSRGRVSMGPSVNEVWSGASSEGVVSRSVRDSARMLDVLQGPESGDPFIIQPPSGTYESALQRDPGRLRIGFSVRSPLGTPVHAQAVAAVESAVATLRSLGHEVEEAEPRIDGHALAVSYLHMYFGHVDALMAQARSAGARRSEFELLTRTLASLGQATPARTFVRELAAWNDHARALGAFHTAFDLFLTPTVATPAPLHGAADLPAAQEWALSLLERTGLLRWLARLGATDGLVQQIARDSLAFVPFTQLANLTGTPAMSVPLHRTPEGLPMGVHFTARFGEEDRLLQLAQQLETAQPWQHHRPDWVKPSP